MENMPFCICIKPDIHITNMS